MISNNLTDIFRKVFNDDSIDITPETSAETIPGWDSLSHIKLMISIEKSFSIRFTAKEISNLNNVGELVSIIKAKLK